MAGFEISIGSSKYSREQIKNIVKNIGEKEPLKIHELEAGARSRGMDPTVLVAIVGAAGTGVGALIAGLFQLISGKKDERIVFRSSSGISIEFPAHLSARELDEKIQKLKQLEINKCQILLP